MWGRQTRYVNSLKFYRGYTGHEMIPEVSLINMNGRMYDPKLGRFLSPDNYVQLPDNPQNLNRYSYCLNNPLKYTDPSGEVFVIDDFLLVVGGAALVGGIVNVASNSEKIKGFGDFVGYFGVGAMAGGVGAALSTVSFGIGGAIGGALTGFVSGAATGLILGGGNSVLDNGNFSHFWGDAFKEAKTGAITGAVLGGISGSISAHNEGRGFWTGGPKNIMGSAFGSNSFADDALRSPNSIVEETMNSSVFPTGSGSNSVYVGYEGSTPKYVGITERSPEIRFNEHILSGTERSFLKDAPINNTGNLSRIQARILEQRLINIYGLGKNGGLLYNKINSISPRYWDIWGIKY